MTFLLVTTWTVSYSQFNFSTPEVLDGSQVTDIGLSDIDTDGDLDVVACFADGIYWYPNSGSGAFAVKSLITPLANRFELQDLDGDNRDDLVVLADSLYWLANTGGGSFASPALILDAQVDILTSVDLDSDGDKDLVVASDGLHWLENLAFGSSWNPALIDTTIDLFFGFANTMTMADISGNGVDDIVAVVDGSSILIRIYFSTLGCPGCDGYWDITYPPGVPYSLICADLNDDGLTDIISGDNNSNRILWYRNSGGVGTIWAPPQTITSIIDGTGGADVVFELDTGDFDLDGRTDLLSASFFDGKVAAYRNNGGGLTGLQQVLGFVNFAQHLKSGDLDSDGDPDVVAGGETLVFIRNQETIPGPCATPAGLSTTLAGAGVILSWADDDPFRLGVQIKGRRIGDPFFGTGQTSASSFTIPSLLSGTSYEWRLRAKCVDGDVSGFSSLDTFSTAPARVLGKNLAGLKIGPNPASKKVYMQIPRDYRALRVSNSFGNVVLRQTLTPGVSEIDVSEWPAGLYLFDFELQSGHTRASMLVK